MSRPFLAFLAVVLLVMITGCRPQLPRPATTEVVWREPEGEVAAGELSELPVTAGSILRFGIDAPVRVAEVVRSSEGDAEIWRTLVPTARAAMLRTGLFTTAIRAPRDVLASVHVGEARDPEVGWFDLEKSALAWADSPLGTPFPDPSATPRIELRDLADVDAALGEAQGNPATAADARKAVRAIVALRAMRALEGLRGYPYAENEDAEMSPADKPRLIDERTYVESSPERPVTVTAKGPAALFVWVRAVRAPIDALAEARVLEGERLRATTRAHVRHPGKATADGAANAAAGDPDVALLHRMTVHVPPGVHAYRVLTTGASSFVAARVSRPVIRLEEALAGTKNEARLLERAKRACGVKGLEPICALALALAGEDGTAAYAAAVRASERTRRAAERLALSGPSDRAAELEAATVSAPADTLRSLGAITADSIDAVYAESWLRATVRETSWEPPEEAAERTWLAFLSPDPNVPACGTTSPKTPVQKPIGAEPVVALAPPWRRVHAVRLLVVSTCEAKDAVKLDVDGEVLTAEPSAPRVLWHVAVRGESARIKRLDQGGGQVFLLSEDACSPRASLVRAPQALTAPAELSFPADATGPGVDVWVKEGAKQGSVTFTSKDGAQKLDVRVTPSGGVLAVDDQGVRWSRGARLPLPPWALRGVRASGTADVSVAAVVRGLRTETTVAREHAHPADVEALVDMSRKIRAAKEPHARATLLLERARLLATYGGLRAALDDAELAKKLGGPDEVEAVRAAVLPPEPKPFTLASAAYGIEPDFDPGATRCKPAPSGPRARLAALDVALRARSKTALLDRALAVQVADAILAAPRDPRSETALFMALQGSRWRVVHDAEAQRVPRASESERNPMLDPEGRLRARIDAGDPFGASFVTVTADRPAKAAILDLAGVKVRMDVVCVVRADNGACPLEVKIGDFGKPLPLQLDNDGKGSIVLPYVKGRGAFVAATIAPGSADSFALVRIVLDKPFPGATEVPNVGWVIDTPHQQYRHLIGPGHPARIKVTAPDVVRIDAKPEPGGASEVVVTAPGVDLSVPETGEPIVVPITKSGELFVSVKKGQATVAIAQRAEAAPVPALEEPAQETVVMASAARTDVDQGKWRDRVEASPRPLSWLQERVGTLEVTTGGAGGTIREGARADKSFDAFALESIGYRRRIESIDLQATLQGQARLRDGNPSFVGLVSLYENIEAIRLRVTGTVVGLTQEVEGASVKTVAPRGFVEYSLRAKSDLFILPRLGFDGYYTSLDKAPKSTRGVDDDLYNAYRFKRNSFGFLQALLWYVPYFNDIFYLRARGTYDLTNGAFGHAALRPGVFFIFHELELGTFVDASYYAATTNARSKSSVDGAAGGTIVVHLPASPGNVEIRPNMTGTVRDDGGWTVWAGISVLASYRRGVRDYSSIELSYPEETSFGIPWRPDRRGP